jgi:hypothetical protein
MANTAKVLFRGAATTNTNTTLYTAPSSTSTVITNIVVTNTTSSPATFTISLNGVVLAPTVAISGFSMTSLDIKQVLQTTQTLTGGASAATVNFHVSGMEIA